MKIASVIVDVPAMNTDKPFDYMVPEEWAEVIRIGMRIVVPFGPRRVQGFVVGFREGEGYPGLKEVLEPLDVHPVLNEELLQLGDWMAEKTLCYKISAYQAMLPAALRAKYEKLIVLSDPSRTSSLPPPLSDMLSEKGRVSWKKAEKYLPAYVLHREAAKGHIEIVYRVKDRADKKEIDVFMPAIGQDEMAKRRKEERFGPRQEKIIDYYLAHFQPHPKSVLREYFGEISSTLESLVKRGILERKSVELYRDPYGNQIFPKTAPLPLTEEQREVIAPILSAIDKKEHRVFLLHGVTGSGKTEVYMQAIEEVIGKGKEAIVLVPEISLTPQMVARFKGRFGGRVAVLHSGLSIGEKYDEWRKIQRKEVQVVVGARSAIFAPFENLGMIIIDEEHETSYKQEDPPRYHARDVAIRRGLYHRCPVILGSATPSLESYARAKKGVYTLLTMAKRIGGQPLPPVEIVDMREEMRAGNRTMFSRLLLDKIKDRLRKGEQTVLLLNRRGFSTFVMCRDCGSVVQCPHCDISLTYHKFHNRMKCHYCGYEEPAPEYCPECGSHHIRFFGSGTQRAEEHLHQLLPEARILRMDVDTTRTRGAHERLLSLFKEGKADILLGTQMIAKGLDFPNVTLAGVLSADTMLQVPDFRSAERTFQLLTQVSGRAGRDRLPGEVVIQTYTPEHYSIQFAKNHDFEHFFQYEMIQRRKGQYPPYTYLVLLQANHPDPRKAAAAMDKIARHLRKSLSEGVRILGPTEAPIAKINNKYRYQCIIKYKREPRLRSVLADIQHAFNRGRAGEGVEITIDIDPYSLI
mgnify:CR=1 FL=1